MCRVDEKIYVRSDGRRSKFQDTSLCERGRRRGKMCSNAEVRRTEYPDPTSSPIASSPITPSFSTQARRPSASSRPSTRDGSIKSLKPEIHIDLTVNKGKPYFSITTGKSKRESAGSNSAFESGGSEASHAVRTGYPEILHPSLNSHLRTQSSRYRHPSPDESIPSSSRLSHVYHNSSDYDTPSLATGTTATSSGTRPVIHHTPHTSAMPAQINTTLGQAGGPASPYRTTEVAPRASRNNGSYTPEITGRDEDKRRRHDEQRKQHEAADRELVANSVSEENQRAHFSRAEERASKTFAGRTDGREQRRRQDHTAQAAKEAAAKEAVAREAAAREAARKMSQTSKPAAPSRRNSVRISATEATKQQLIDAEARQMRKERAEAEVREREEQLYQQQPPAFQQQQSDSRHYDQPVPRRNSLSSQARPDLIRSNSKRGAAPEPREPRREPRQPPVSFYNNTTRTDLPQAREPRRPSSSHANRPFMPTAPSADLWDVRNVSQALPSARNMGQPLPRARGPGVGHNFPQPQANVSYPQQASHRMQQALYTDEYQTDSEDGHDPCSPRRRH
ncbi:uncharacterized protein M421DRAFT_354471 [Didymella exigua CBS 183.55]|uniref:Uncharacterized protein n=1 Tax=Didymella exigua CBS 183.55 TaxID=1150837 RepID=A0A6A5R387_9PLEO|nr:uncharacterized protein M421DRAFT_354471 [Didymella exigua CBS 183.55]KAF1922525.1 hypothetical protein M421DRAFT_354471 [Didymella exigua CBS 183.55]